MAYALVLYLPRIPGIFKNAGRLYETEGNMQLIVFYKLILRYNITGIMDDELIAFAVSSYRKYPARDNHSAHSAPYRNECHYYR